MKPTIDDMMKDFPEDGPRPYIPEGMQFWVNNLFNFIKKQNFII